MLSLPMASIILFAVLAITSPIPHAHTISPLVHLPYATYLGTTLQPSNINQWLGISYAAPPLGDLRWRAPIDPLPNNTILPATDFAPTCIGSGGPVLSSSTNEDCLYLNIFAPTNASNLLPVWFFIQGGGYAGDEDQNFNGTELASHGLVLVQINYRVGVFGFLASEKVREDGDLNVGLLDQRKALEWVRRWIHLFGGDPERVVIHGDSAGAGSVAFQMSAYGGKDEGLFRGAIAESPFWPTHRYVWEMEAQFEIFARNLSCWGMEDVMACLRSKDTATVQESDVASPFLGQPETPLPEWYWLPVVDGVFSTDYLYNLFERGEVVRVPLMVGDDTDEGTGFVSAWNANTSADLLTFMAVNYPNLSDRDLQVINATYPQSAFPPSTFAGSHGPYYAASAAAYGESTFTCPGLVMGSSLARYNSPSQTWSYRYDVHTAEDDAGGYGVPHVAEKAAIWGLGNAGSCDEPCTYAPGGYNADIVPVVMDYWTSFVIHLDPNHGKAKAAPVWESLDEGPRRLVFQTNQTRMEVVPAQQLGRCEVWKRLASHMQQ